MKDHWNRSAPKGTYNIKISVNYRTNIPVSTSAQSSVYGKQGKKEKDKNVTMCSSNAARDQVFKVN